MLVSNVVRPLLHNLEKELIYLKEYVLNKMLILNLWQVLKQLFPGYSRLKSWSFCHVINFHQQLLKSGFPSYFRRGPSGDGCLKSCCQSFITTDPSAFARIFSPPHPTPVLLSHPSITCQSAFPLTCLQLIIHVLFIAGECAWLCVHM